MSEVGRLLAVARLCDSPDEPVMREKQHQADQVEKPQMVPAEDLHKAQDDEDKARQPQQEEQRIPPPRCPRVAPPHPATLTISLVDWPEFMHG